MSNNPQCFAMQKKLAEYTQKYYDSVYELGPTHKETNRLFNLRNQIQGDVARMCGQYNPTPTQAAEDAKAGGLFTPKQNALSGLRPGAAQPTAAIKASLPGQATPVPPTSYVGPGSQKQQPAFGGSGFRQY